jgi:hypothetical protein
MVYYNARFFTSRSNFIHGLLAVGLFLSLQYFSQTAGSAMVDLAAMFMVMVMVTIFMASIRNNHESKWLVAGLGFVFVLAFRTKETALITGLFFIGLGFSEGRFRLKEFLTRFVYVAAGMLGGFLVFGMLNWIILGDPLVGLRISNIRDFLSSYATNVTSQSQQDAVAGNWYTAFFLGVI